MLSAKQKKKKFQHLRHHLSSKEKGLIEGTKDSLSFTSLNLAIRDPM
jgi:hypothetical protein